MVLELLWEILAHLVPASLGPKLFCKCKHSHSSTMLLQLASTVGKWRQATLVTASRTKLVREATVRTDNDKCIPTSQRKYKGSVPHRERSVREIGRCSSETSSL